MARERDIVVDVTVRSDTKGAKEAARALGDVDKAAGGAGKSMHGMEADAKSLDTQIGKSKENIKGLEAELTRVGNNPGIRKALRVERSWLAELEKIQKSVAGIHAPELKPADLMPGGNSGGYKLSMPELDFSGLSSKAMPALIGLAAVASPAIGAMVAGAVVGAVGAGGILGGVVAASSDPRVQDAWKGFTEDLTGDAFGRQAFIEPVIEGINILKKGFAELHIGDALAKGASAVPILAAGISRFANSIMPGFNAVMEHGDEIARIFSGGLAEVGGALSGMLTDFATSKGSMDGLRLIFDLTSDAIKFTDQAVTDLGDGFHHLAGFTASYSGVLADVMGWLPLVGNSIKDGNTRAQEYATGTGNVVTGLRKVGGASTEAAEATRQLGDGIEAATEALETFINTQLGFDQAIVSMEKANRNLGDSIKENGRHWEDNTAAAENNQQALFDAIAAAERLREQQIKATGDIAGANKEYDDQVTSLLGIARQAGATKEFLDRVAGTYTITIIGQVFTNAIQGAAALAANAFKKLFGGHRAAGGKVMAGVPYTINERGSETVTFPAGGTVHPANLTPAMSAGGSSNITLRVASAGGEFADFLAMTIRRYVTVEADGDVQMAFGR